MELRHLRYFLCVAEEMHFGRAARRLGISQPPLSQQIRALEEELGAPLFERTSRRVSLTEVGRRFEVEARATLAQADHAMRAARRAHLGQIGELALGFTASGPFVPRVASALYRFRQTHPHVELTLREMGRDDQVEAVEKGELDMGLVRGFDMPIIPAGLAATKLLEEDMMLAIRHDHPLANRPADPAIADLRDEPIVLYTATQGAGFNEDFVARCEQEGFRPRITQEAGSLATLLGLAAAGFGSTLLARSLTRLHVDNLVYRRMATPVLTRLWLIQRATPSPTAQAFRAAILES